MAIKAKKTKHSSKESKTSLGRSVGAHKSTSKHQTTYEMQAEICAALAHPIRLHILDLLANREMTSSDLNLELKLPKASLSQHLGVLRDAGVISSRREGLFQYLSLGIPQIKQACALVRAVLIEKISQEEKINTEMIRELKAQG